MRILSTDHQLTSNQQHNSTTGGTSTSFSGNGGGAPPGGASGAGRGSGDAGKPQCRNCRCYHFGRCHWCTACNSYHSPRFACGGFLGAEMASLRERVAVLEAQRAQGFNPYAAQPPLPPRQPLVYWPHESRQHTEDFGRAQSRREQGGFQRRGGGRRPKEAKKQLTIDEEVELEL